MVQSNSNQSEIDTFVIAYPNPFTNNFNFKLATINNDEVSVKVYDMFGKLIDIYNVNDTDIENIEIGTNYKTGIYNIVVSQGEFSSSLRIIKK